MPQARRFRIRTIRRAPIAWGVGVCLAAALIAAQQWWSGSRALERMQRYRLAVDALDRLQRERRRVVDDLVRNNRLTAWREAGIQEVSSEIVSGRREIAKPAFESPGAEVAGYFDVAVAEEEINLANSRKRYEDLEQERLALEELIASQKEIVRQFVDD